MFIFLGLLDWRPGNKNKEIMRKLFLYLVIPLLLVVSCTKNESSEITLNNLIGSEWSYSGDEVTIGLKFYANNEVTSFLDNQYGISTVSGYYELIESSKILSFSRLVWYDAETGRAAMMITGAHIVSGSMMENVVQTSQKSVFKQYMYRNK